MEYGLEIKLKDGNSQWPNLEKFEHVKSVVNQNSVGEFYVVGKIAGIYCDVFEVSPNYT